MPMKIYDVAAIPEGYIALNYIPVECDELWPVFEGKPLKSSWGRYDLEFVTDEKGKVGDFAYLCPGVLCCSFSTKEVLSSHIDNIEWLPLNIIGQEAPWFLINVIDVRDALDKEKSTIEYFDDESVDVMDVEHYSFMEVRLSDALLFKVPETAVSDIFCSGDFKNLVQELRLKGLCFQTPK